MTNSTPFSNWMQDGSSDPFEGLYDDKHSHKLSLSSMPSKELADALVYGSYDYSKIACLTAGKERLRLLSRTLYLATEDHSNLNEIRATLPEGQLTDYTLANAFFERERPADLKAGKQRILWLESEIEKIKYKKNSET